MQVLGLVLGVRGTCGSWAGTGACPYGRWIAIRAGSRVVGPVALKVCVGFFYVQFFDPGVSVEDVVAFALEF